MSNDVTLFDEQQQLPSHLQDMFGDDSNIDSGAKINSLSIRGKVFRIVYEGEENPIMRYNEETQDKEPVSTVNLIVINQGPFGARVYYGSAYNPDNNEGPKCFSLDGKKPHASAPEIQSQTCATCPHAVKGSKVTPNGTVTTACQLQRRLAVVPAKKPDFAPLLLRLAPTSAYDPDTKNNESGWMAWRQYLDFLNARGVRHTAQLVTKLRFDPNAEHPKLLFKPERFLNEEEAKIIAPRVKSEEVEELIFGAEDAPIPADAVKPDVTHEDMDKDETDSEPEDEETEDEAPTKKKKVAKKKTAKKKVAKKAAEDDDDDDDELPERVAAAGSKPPKSSGDNDSAVDSLLDDWDA